jgi:hypothetical protein
MSSHPFDAEWSSDCPEKRSLLAGQRLEGAPKVFHPGSADPVLGIGVGWCLIGEAHDCRQADVLVPEGPKHGRQTAASTQDDDFVTEP